MSEVNTPAHQLPAGTLLSDKYVIIRTLGEGGFGITYKGRNKTLDIFVAIKEYYPNGFANRSSAYDLTVAITDSTKNSYFSKWKDKFLNEARALAKFSNITNIVNVLDFFEQNGTAYIVMEYLDGITLSNYVSKNGVFDAEELCRMMIPMLKSLHKIHQKKLIHRDISPDNIMMMPDRSLKLFDFGAARDYSEAEQKSLSVMLKPGFAPEEQYRSKGNQGPWTDVYAACATIYFCITGIRPDDSLDRVFSDQLKRPSEFGIKISPQIEEAILVGMSVKAENRFKTAEALATAFEASLSVSEQTASSELPTKKFTWFSKANKKTKDQNDLTEITDTEFEVSAENGAQKTNSTNQHAEIVRTEIEISEDDTEKKTSFLDIMTKIAAKLNIKIAAGAAFGIFILGSILTGTLIDNEMHRGDITNYSENEYSVPDFSTHEVSLPSLQYSYSSKNSVISVPHANDYLNLSSVIENPSIPDLNISSNTQTEDDVLSKYDISTPAFSSFVESYLTSKENTAVKDLFGTWNGTTYISDFFGFKCELGSDWYIMPDGYLESVHNVSEVSQEYLEEILNSTGDVIVMGAMNMTNTGNLTVAISDSKITHMPIGNEYFIAAPLNVKYSLKQQYGIDAEVTIINVDFCGKSTRAVFTISGTSDLPQYQIQVPVFKGDYMASIIFTANTEQATKELIESFSKM